MPVNCHAPAGEDSEPAGAQSETRVRMDLFEALDVQPGDCVAVVGAGGKTSLCWRLARELSARGHRVVFTTTTRIRQPAPGAFDLLKVSDTLTASSAWRTACIASAIDGPIDDTPVAESFMPAVHTKLAGFSAEAVCRLREALAQGRAPVTLLVEADGARGLLLKAPADYEPVIPPCANLVCVVAGLDALGRPLDERVAHRVERITALTRVQAGDIITPDMMVALLSHRDGGLKDIPAGARAMAVLNQRDAHQPHPNAARIARGLIPRGFDRAVVVALRAAQPVLQVIESATSTQAASCDAA